MEAATSAPKDCLNFLTPGKKPITLPNLDQPVFIPYIAGSAGDFKFFTE
jgi:hypothetical protein